MSLSPLDDYPVHQVAEPIRRVGPSDRHFYDRYYFNCHALDEDLCLIAGFGCYPNLGTVDGFVVVVHGSDHRVVRASRELGTDRMDTSVGPFRVEVLEGLRRLRLLLDPSDDAAAAGLALDLTFTASIPAQEEPRHLWRQNHRVVFDTTRLAQTGRWSGSLSVGDRTFDVSPERWWGCRDRSWGVRPVGEPEPPGIRAARPPAMYWNYAQAQFDDFSIVYMVQEERDGSRVLDAPDVQARKTGVVDTVGRFELPDGTVGYGLWEYAVGGPHDRYGFQSYTDGWRGSADSTTSAG